MQSTPQLKQTIMDITDDLFPQRDEFRRADHSNEDAAPVAAPSANITAPPGSGSISPSIALPPGFGLTYSVAVNGDPLPVTLSPALFGRLVFAILDTAAGLALGPANEWQPSARWLEKQAMQARGEPWPYVQPEGWRPSRTFCALADPLAAQQLPASVIAAVQAILAEGFIAFDGLSDERRAMAQAFLPAVSATPVPEAPRVRAAFPVGDGVAQGFAAVLGRPDGAGNVAAFLPCPFPTLQCIAAWLTDVIAVVGLKLPSDQAAEALSDIASGELDAQWTFVLVGLIALAASECNVCPEHRRTFLKDHAVFKDAIDCARYLV